MTYWLSPSMTEREHRITSALTKEGLPAPKPFVFFDDPSVIGAPIAPNVGAGEHVSQTPG